MSLFSLAALYTIYQLFDVFISLGKAEVQDFLKQTPGFPHSWNKVHTKVMNEVYKREKRVRRVIPE